MDRNLGPTRRPPSGPVHDRRSFLAMGAAGVMATVLGCGGNTGAMDLDGRVIIVGAGPAGLTAAHHLQQRGVDFEVLEAAPTHGGRTRLNREFTDFPLPLGAEWLHVGRGVLDEIVNDPAVVVASRLQPYVDDDRLGYFDGTTLTLNTLEDWGDDTKWVGSGWLDFFDTYVVPGIADHLVYDTPVAAIDHRSDAIDVIDTSGVVRSADRVIVTVPLKLLQRGDIEFVPPLGRRRQDVIDNATVWSGLKAFLAFDQRFYPAVIAFPDSETADGQRLYYDAAYGQETDENILGLFSVGLQAERYQALDDDARLRRMLDELDQAFDGAASRHYRHHLVQDWNAEPFAAAAYLAEVEPSDTSRRLAEPIDNRVFFAGDAYTSFDDWGSVHAAARSAIEAVERLVSSR